MTTATAKRGAYRVASTTELQALAKHAETVGFYRKLDPQLVADMAPEGRHVLELLIESNLMGQHRVKVLVTRKTQPSPVEAYLDVNARDFDKLATFSDQGTR